MLNFLLFILPLLGLCGRLHIMTMSYDGKIIQGVIDPTTGEMDQTNPVNLPDTECDPGWVLGKGGPGQTSEVFYGNGTFFFFAQEHCGNSISNTTLFEVFPYGRYSRELAKFPELDAQLENSLLNYHLSWDWICNLIVVVRNYYKLKDLTQWHYRSIEVSSFDGQKRPLPDQGSDTSRCRDCWHWVKGVSGVDPGPVPDQRCRSSMHNQNGTNFHNQNGSSMHDNEVTCQNCVFYTLEEQVVNYDVQKPRRLIGRGLHNGSVVINATDICQLQAMSYLPNSYFFSGDFFPGDIFIGLGVCCELSWCPEMCEGHGGKLSIVEWRHNNYSAHVLLVLPFTPDDLGPLGMQMGIAMDLRGFPVNQTYYTPRFSLWINQKIYSYQITVNEWGMHSVSKIAKSPDLSLNPLLWAYIHG